MQNDVVTASDILAAAARLRRNNLVYRTPLELCEPLSAKLGLEVWQKLELYQPTGSFKLRGATNKLLAFLELESANNTTVQPVKFLTVSAGNHGLGVAHAARQLGLNVTVVVPKAASPAKVEALQRYPITLIQYGDSYDAAELYARQLEQEQGYVFVSPYNSVQVIAGQGTIALEILEDLPQADVLLVPVGGGGLISGVALWAKTVRPDIRIIGIQSVASPAMHAALAAGKIVPAPDLPTYADGLAGGLEAATITFALTQRYVDEIVLVSEEDLANAIRYYIRELHLIVEGSGAVGMAALLADKLHLPSSCRKLVNLVTGRNIAPSTLATLAIF
jgi:threonine dehydratase